MPGWDKTSSKCHLPGFLSHLWLCLQGRKATVMPSAGEGGIFIPIKPSHNESQCAVRKKTKKNRFSSILDGLEAARSSGMWGMPWCRALEKLMQEFDPTLAAVGMLGSLLPTLPFLRMLCSALIATELFLEFKGRRKTSVYSVLSHFCPL